MLCYKGKGSEVGGQEGRRRFRWGLCSLSGRRLRGNRMVLTCRVALLCWAAGNASRCLAPPAFAVFAPQRMAEVQERGKRISWRKFE